MRIVRRVEAVATESWIRCRRHTGTIQVEIEALTTGQIPDQALSSQMLATMGVLTDQGWHRNRPEKGREKQIVVSKKNRLGAQAP